MQHLNKINIYDSISDSQSVNSLGFSRSRVCVWIVISRVSCVYVGLVRVVRDPQQRARESRFTRCVKLPMPPTPRWLCQPSRRAQQREQRRGNGLRCGVILCGSRRPCALCSPRRCDAPAVQLPSQHSPDLVAEPRGWRSHEARDAWAERERCCDRRGCSVWRHHLPVIFSAP